MPATDPLAAVRSPTANGHRFVVVEQQRRQRGRRRAGSRRPRPPCLYRIAELAQPVDVVADGAGGDLQPPREVGAGPVGSGLQQRQQPQEARGGLQPFFDRNEGN